ncbi:MAG TPA: hypothetical protein VF884_14915 [Nitrososphaeraceae archaeon]
MQSLKGADQLKEISKRLLDEIQDTQRQIFPDHAPTFNNSLKNKIRLMRQILRLMDRYPNMTAKRLLYLLDCKIEGEKFLLDFAKTIDVTDEHFDNLDNLEWIRFAVRKAGNAKWED